MCLEAWQPRRVARALAFEIAVNARVRTLRLGRKGISMPRRGGRQAIAVERLRQGAHTLVAEKTRTQVLPRNR